MKVGDLCSPNICDRHLLQRVRPLFEILVVADVLERQARASLLNLLTELCSHIARAIGHYSERVRHQHVVGLRGATLLAQTPRHLGHVPHIACVTQRHRGMLAGLAGFGGRTEHA